MSNDANLVRITDLADITGVPRPTLSTWRRREPDFPTPAARDTRGALYDRDTVVAWVNERSDASNRSTALNRSHVSDLLAALATGVPNPTRDAPGLPDSARLSDELLDKAVLDGPDRIEIADTLIATLSQRESGTESTPSHLAAFVASLLDPHESLLDPNTGFGTLLSATAVQTRRVAGQDTDPTALDIARHNLRLRGIDADLETGDAVIDDAFPGELFDSVICQPAFGHKRNDIDPNDLRWRFSVPKDDVEALIQHCIAHLNPGGRAVIAVPGSFGSSTMRTTQELRSGLVRNGWVRAVISLPPRALASPVAVDLLILDHPIGTARPVLMANPFAPTGIRRPGTPPWTEDEAFTSAELIRGYLAEPNEQLLPDRYAAVTLEALAGTDFSLTTTRHLIKIPPAKPYGDAVEYVSCSIDTLRQTLADMADSLDTIHSLTQQRPDRPSSIPPDQSATIRIGDLFTVTRPTHYTNEVARPNEDGAVPIYSVDELIRDMPEDWVHLATNPTWDAKGGELLIDSGKLPLKWTFAERQVMLDPSTLVVRPNGPDADVDYLAGWLSTPAGRATVARESSGSPPTHIRARNFAAIEIPYPDPPVVTAVAELVRQVDQLRDQQALVGNHGARLIDLIGDYLYSVLTELAT